MLWLTKGVSIRLLARTAGHTWVRCCSGRTVRNSESLRGLRDTLQERRGRGKARALLGPLAVRTYRTGAKALSGQSRADDGYGYIPAKAVWTYQTGVKALSGQSRADESDGSKGFAVPKPCGRWLWLGSCQSRADERTYRTGVKASRQVRRRADRREGEQTGAKASRQARRLCRVKAVRTSGQAMRPRLRWALS